MPEAVVTGRGPVPPLHTGTPVPERDCRPMDATAAQLQGTLMGIQHRRQLVSPLQYVHDQLSGLGHQLQPRGRVTPQSSGSYADEGQTDLAGHGRRPGSQRGGRSQEHGFRVLDIPVPEAGRRVDQRLGCPDRADSERRLDGLVARAHQDRGDGVGLDQGARHQLPVLRGHRQCESHLGLASSDVPVGGAEPCLRGHSLGLTGQLDERGGANERVARERAVAPQIQERLTRLRRVQSDIGHAEHCRRELPAHLVDHARPHDQVANPIRSLGQYLRGEVVDGASVRKLHCGLGRRRAFQRKRRKAYATRPPVRMPVHEPGSQVSRIDLVPGEHLGHLGHIHREL